MFIPYSVDVPMIRYPFANWALMAAILVVSVGDWIVEGDAGERHVTPLALQPRAFALVQLVTHLFAHGDIMHLVGNLLFLFVFGNAIDAKLGHLWFLLCFLLFGILAGLVWLILGNGMPAVGASGAIMGLMGMFLVLYPRNDVTIFVYTWWNVGDWVWHIPSWIVITLYLIEDLLMTYLDANGAIAYVAHLGGAAAGIVLTAALLALGWIKSAFYEENLLQMLGYMEKTPRHGKKKRREANED